MKVFNTTNIFTFSPESNKSQYEQWQREFDLYQCGSKPKDGGCFCGFLQDRLLDESVSFSSAGPSACYNGFACTPEQNYPCQDIELSTFLGLSELNAANGSPSDEVNDVWGWEDPNGGLEVAIIGTFSGTAFVDVTDPANPIYLGKLPTRGSFGSSWRGVSFVIRLGGHVKTNVLHIYSHQDYWKLRAHSLRSFFSWYAGKLIIGRRCPFTQTQKVFYLTQLRSVTPSSAESSMSIS